MKIEYRKIFNKNYAVISDYNISDYKECYRSKMLKSNKLDQFLAYDTQNINGTVQFTYDISSKQSVYSFYENSDIDYETIRHLIMSLKTAFDTLNNYLLEPDYVVLDPKMIYMNVATKALYFCYCPGEKNNFYESLNSLICYILSKINHEDTNCIILAYSLQQQSINANYTFDDLIEILNKQVFNHQSNHINQTEQTQKNQKTDICDSNIYENQDNFYTPSDHYESDSFSDISKHFSKKNSKWPVIIPVFIFFAALAAIMYYGLVLQAISVELMVILSGITTFLCFELFSYFKNKPQKKQKQTSNLFKASSPPCPKPADTSFEDREYFDAAKNQSIKPVKNNFMKSLSIENNFCKNNLTEIDSAEIDLEEIDLEENNSKKIDLENNYYEDTIILGYRSSESLPRLVYTGTDFVSENELTSFPFIIGKMTDNVNMMIDNPMISRIHAKIYLKEGHYYIEDMNSSNGTYINNTLIQPHSLTEIDTGDYITFSHLTYIFQ